MRHFFLILAIIGFSFSAVSARDIILIKKFSPDENVRDWLKVIEKRQIKTTLIYPFACGENEKSYLKKLLEAGIVSLAVTVEDEPFWPLLDDFDEDLAAIVANARLGDEFSLTASALFLKQPLSSGVLRAIAGSGWRIVFCLSSEFKIQRWNDLLILNLPRQVFSDAADCKNYLISFPAPVVVLYLDEKNPFSPQQFAEITEIADEDRFIFPPDIPLNNFAPVSDINLFEETLNIFSSRENSLRWSAVLFARDKFQQYKNSGQADVFTVRQAQEKIYHLYSAELLLSENSDNFWKDWQKLLGLLKVSSAEFFSAGSLRSLAVASETFKSENSRFWTNLSSENIISGFGVEITTTSELVFRIETSTADFSSFIFDIYIDLNNRRGSGSTRLLFDDSEVLKPEDGWEWALTISENFATLIKFRNFQAVKKYPVVFDSEKKQIYLKVDTQDIGSSPRYWGYLVLARKEKEILDVLGTEKTGFKRNLEMLRW